jgi:ABC-2 type transport system permease protein
MTQLSRALSISRKDIESYYGKPPLITWGLFFPAVLLLSMYVRDPATYAAVAPGVIAMTLLFGNTSMAAIVVTFEKRSGTLQRLLIAPVAHQTILLGKAASAAAFGIATSLVLTAGLALCFRLTVVRPVPFALGLALGAVTFALMGLILSLMVREVFEAMTLLNLFRFPILFISGVFMPVDQLPGWLQGVAWLSPLTYVVELLRLGLEGRSYFPTVWVPSLLMLAFAGVAWWAAARFFPRGARR